MSPNSNSHPGEPHHTGNDTIGDAPLDRVVVYPCHHQTQATIDHSQSQENPTRPNMGDCPHGTLVVLLVHVMMDEASNGLKGESSNNDDANDGMTIAGRKLNVK